MCITLRITKTYTKIVIHMPLIDTQLRNAKPTQKDYTLNDGQGLSILITAKGGKWWRFRYRHDGKPKMLSFGTYPEVSLAEARARRDEARKLLAQNPPIDPGEAKKQAQAENKAHRQNTFSVWADKWFEHWKEDKSPSHADYTQRRLSADILPVIGDMPIAEITAVHIADIIRSISKRGALDVAKKSKQTISQVFRYAIANDNSRTITRNPALDIMYSDIVKPRKAKNLARVDIKELPALLRAIDTSETRAVTRIAIKLMAYTFVRTSELIEARWHEFDLAAKEWRIPAERMKMPSPHIVPLANQAIELLQTLQEITGRGELLFPNQNYHSKPMSNGTILMALKRMGYKGRMTGHGFRGIASTALHEQGYDHQHIELQLAHSPRDAVSAAYNHALYIPQRASMMQAWADYLDELKAGAKVMPFKQA